MLSKNSLEILMDLIEIKLSCLQVYDKEDARELLKIKHCKSELNKIIQEGRTLGGRVGMSVNALK